MASPVVDARSFVPTQESFLFLGLGVKRTPKFFRKWGEKDPAAAAARKEFDKYLQEEAKVGALMATLATYVDAGDDEADDDLNEIKGNVSEAQAVLQKETTDPVKVKPNITHAIGLIKAQQESSKEALKWANQRAKAKDAIDVAKGRFDKAVTHARLLTTDLGQDFSNELDLLLAMQRTTEAAFNDGIKDLQDLEKKDKTANPDRYTQANEKARQQEAALKDYDKHRRKFEGYLAELRVAGENCALHEGLLARADVDAHKLDYVAAAKKLSDNLPALQALADRATKASRENQKKKLEEIKGEPDYKRQLALTRVHLLKLEAVAGGPEKAIQFSTEIDKLANDTEGDRSYASACRQLTDLDKSIQAAAEELAAQNDAKLAALEKSNPRLTRFKEGAERDLKILNEIDTAESFIEFSARRQRIFNKLLGSPDGTEGRSLEILARDLIDRITQQNKDKSRYETLRQAVDSAGDDMKQLLPASRCETDYEIPLHAAMELANESHFGDASTQLETLKADVERERADRRGAYEGWTKQAAGIQALGKDLATLTSATSRAQLHAVSQGTIDWEKVAVRALQTYSQAQALADRKGFAGALTALEEARDLKGKVDKAIAPRQLLVEKQQEAQKTFFDGQLRPLSAALESLAKAAGVKIEDLDPYTKEVDAVGNDFKADVRKTPTVDAVNEVVGKKTGEAQQLLQKLTAATGDRTVIADLKSKGAAAEKARDDFATASQRARKHLDELADMLMKVDAAGSGLVKVADNLEERYQSCADDPALSLAHKKAAMDAIAVEAVDAIGRVRDKLKEIEADRSAARQKAHDLKAKLDGRKEAIPKALRKKLASQLAQLEALLEGNGSKTAIEWINEELKKVEHDLDGLPANAMDYERLQGSINGTLKELEKAIDELGEHLPRAAADLEKQLDEVRQAIPERIPQDAKGKVDDFAKAVGEAVAHLPEILTNRSQFDRQLPGVEAALNKLDDVVAEKLGNGKAYTGVLRARLEAAVGLRDGEDKDRIKNAITELAGVQTEAEQIAAQPDALVKEEQQRSDAKKELELRKAKWQNAYKEFEGGPLKQAANAVRDAKKGDVKLREKLRDKWIDDAAFVYVRKLGENADKLAIGAQDISAVEQAEARLQVATRRAVELVQNPEGAGGTHKNDLPALKRRWQAACKQFVKQLTDLAAEVQSSGENTDYVANATEVQHILAKYTAQFRPAEFDKVTKDLGADPPPDVATQRKSREDGVRRVRRYRHLLLKHPLTVPLASAPFDQKAKRKPLLHLLKNLELSIITSAS